MKLKELYEIQKENVLTMTRVFSLMSILGIISSLGFGGVLCTIPQSNNTLLICLIYSIVWIVLTGTVISLLKLIEIDLSDKLKTL